MSLLLNSSFAFSGEIWQSESISREFFDSSVDFGKHIEHSVLALQTTGVLEERRVMKYLLHGVSQRIYRRFASC